MCVSAATCGVRHSYVAAWEVVKRWKYVYLGVQGFKHCFFLNLDAKTASKLLKMVSTWPLDIARCPKIKTETIDN